MLMVLNLDFFLDYSHMLKGKKRQPLENEKQVNCGLKNYNNIWGEI